MIYMILLYMNYYKCLYLNTLNLQTFHQYFFFSHDVPPFPNLQIFISHSSSPCRNQNCVLSVSFFKKIELIFTYFVISFDMIYGVVVWWVNIWFNYAMFKVIKILIFHVSFLSLVLKFLLPLFFLDFSFFYQTEPCFFPFVLFPLKLLC